MRGNDHPTLRKRYRRRRIFQSIVGIVFVTAGLFLLLIHERQPCEDHITQALIAAGLIGTGGVFINEHLMKSWARLIISALPWASPPEQGDESNGRN